MFNEDLDNLLLFLKDVLNEYDYINCEEKFKYFYEEIKKLKEEFPTIEKLNELREIALYLELKYEAFYEIDNYFNPIYSKIKSIIHEDEVEKLRKENRRKKGIN